MDKALQTMIDNMPEKTGKSLQEWKRLLQTKKFTKHGEAVKFLKESHGVTHGFANTIVALSKEEAAAPEDLIAQQYHGKEGLKPLYEKLMATVVKLGPEVTITPKKESVSLIRKKQFALIKPATKTRLDLGLKLTGKPMTERLQHSGPFGTMCTHRVQLTSLDEVDPELAHWLAEAYEKAT
jgi:predicted transport protein